ncbi:MAG: STAS domain-containing protein [Terriglobia bacterium]
MALTIEEKKMGGVTVLKISGRVSLGDESSMLRTRLKDTVASSVKQIVLDLSEVSYLDSAGLGTLVAGFTSARNQGANLKLANLTRKLHEQLQITKLVTVFEVFDSVDAAVKSFA